MKQILQILTDMTEHWRQSDRPVTTAIPAKQLRAQIDLGITQSGCEIDELREVLQTYLDTNPDVSQPGFMKLLFSGLSQPALLGDWVASISNATMHTYQVAPVATLMELELLQQWNQLIGFANTPEGGDGVMVSGGTQANLVAMLLARHRACPEIKTRGMSTQRLLAFTSDQSHYSMQKAANVLGIGTDNLVAVESDELGRLRPDKLHDAVSKSVSEGATPFFVGLTAGTTVIGAFDQVAECAEVTRHHNLWLHIDGAWGAPVLFSERHRHLLAGCELADSFAWDAHKFMNVPVTAAAILVRQKGLLLDACSGGGGEYLFHSDENAEFNLGERSLQCGRRADALKVWTAWKVAGNQGFAAKMDKLQSLRESCVATIREDSSLELLAPANYLNVLFRYRPDKPVDEEESRKLNIAICKAMADKGNFYVDYAKHRGRTGIRLILANDALDESFIKAFLGQCIRLGQTLGNQ